MGQKFVYRECPAQTLINRVTAGSHEPSTSVTLLEAKVGGFDGRITALENRLNALEPAFNSFKTWATSQINSLATRVTALESKKATVPLKQTYPSWLCASGNCNTSSLNRSPKPVKLTTPKADLCSLTGANGLWGQCSLAGTPGAQWTLTAIQAGDTIVGCQVTCCDFQ